MKTIISMIGALLCAANLYAAPLTLNEIGEAACRVSVPRAMGSGICFKFDGSKYYVLTNFHVVENNSAAFVEFFKYGYKTKKIEGKVVWRSFKDSSDVDFAIIAIDKEKFADYAPRVIPLMGPDEKIKSGDYIASVGCPEGRWAQGWEGHFNGNSNSRLYFVPAPVGGQSGSGVIVNIKTKNGYVSKVGAIVTYQISEGILKIGKGDNGYVGGAIPIATLYKVLSKQTYKPVSFSPLTHRYMSYVLCSNGQVYESYINGNGKECVDIPNGTTVIQWDYAGGCCPPAFGYRGGNGRIIPPGGSDGLFEGSNGNITPDWLQQDEENEEDELPEPENPLPPIPEVIVPPKPPVITPPAVTPPAVKPPAPKKPAVTPKTETKLVGWFDSFGGGILTTFAFGVIILIWRKFGKKVFIRKVDSLEDYLQKKVENKWGKEVGEEVRDAMEGVESAFLELVEATVDGIQQKKAVKVSRRGQVAAQVRSAIQGMESSKQITEVLKK